MPNSNLHEDDDQNSGFEGGFCACRGDKVTIAKYILAFNIAGVHQ